MGTSDFGLHKILIYAMKNGEGKRGKYLEREMEENIFWWKSRRMEKEEEENIWRIKFFLAEEKEGKEEKEEKKEKYCGRKGRTGGRESKAL